MLEEFFLLLPFLMERAKAGRLKCAANARVAEAHGSWPQNGSGPSLAAGTAAILVRRIAKAGTGRAE
jgi:hypothetical protein